MIKLFDHTVLPILTYGSEIYGYENIEMIEKVHNEFLRKITKSRKSTPMSFLYGELGRHPIAITVQTRMIQFWTRMLLGKEQKLSLTIYKYMLNQSRTEFKWMTKIKNILNTVGRPDIWLNQRDIQQINLNPHALKQTLIDQFKQSWHDQLLQTNKGRIYNSFKHDINFETYLTKLNKSEWLHLFKFRTANHLLPVETGRYDGTPFENRNCPLCPFNAIGSEKHYLTVCNYFNEDRVHYLGADVCNNINRFGMKYLLAEAPTNVLKNVTKLLAKIMSMFKR